MSQTGLLSSAGVQWAALPGDDGWPLWYWRGWKCWEVVSLSQKQSRDLPCSMELEKWAPSHPATRSALSNDHQISVMSEHKERQWLNHLCYLAPCLPFLFPFFLYFITHRIPRSRLWLGGLSETMWGRSSSPAVLPNCKLSSVSYHSFHRVIEIRPDVSLKLKKES